MREVYCNVLWPLSSPRRLHCAFLLLLLTSMVLVTGCGGSGGEPKNSVGGKVTLDGQNVAGVVTFIWPDDKEKASPISPTGEYSILEPTPGKVKVVVKGMIPGAKGLIAPPAGSPDTPAMKGTIQGANPPAKYESAATTPLTFEVKTGKQKYDIMLAP